MKKTYIKIIFDEIRSSLGRFLAIFSIVALSIGFLCGLLTTTPDMNATADLYYDENNAADINIKGTMGLTEKDYKIVSAIEGIEQIMQAYVTDVLLEGDGVILNTKLFGLPLLNSNEKLINNLQIVDGRMPESSDECVVEKSWGLLANIGIGTKLTISKENDDYEDIGDTYNVLEYKVVGIVENPYYFSVEAERSTIGNGITNALVYTDESSYALDVHTDFFITIKDAVNYKAFTDEYEDYVELYVESLEDLGKEQSNIRLADIKNEAYEELNDAKRKYEDAKFEAETELNDAAEKIEDGKRKLRDASKEIEDGKKELADGKATLNKEIADAKIEIEDGYEKLSEAKIELEDGEVKYSEGYEDLVEGEKEYEDGLAEFLDAEQELLDAQKEFDDGEKEFLDGVKKLEQGKKELESGSRRLASARNQLAQAEEEYNKGYAELRAQEANFNALTNQVIALTTSSTAITFTSQDEFFIALENDTEGILSNIVTMILLNIKDMTNDKNIPSDAQTLIFIRNSINQGKQELQQASLMISDGWDNITAVAHS